MVLAGAPPISASTGLSGEVSAFGAMTNGRNGGPSESSEAHSRGKKPLQALTTDILKTFIELQQRQAVPVPQQPPPEKCDWRCLPEATHSRYNLVNVDKPLGRGAFGVVVKAHTQDQVQWCAVKIVEKQFAQAAIVEKHVLEKLAAGGVTDHANIVTLLDSFTLPCVHGTGGVHQCLVYELLSCSLYHLQPGCPFDVDTGGAAASKAAIFFLLPHCRLLQFGCAAKTSQTISFPMNN
mmetsp:Transcript_29140/g.67597  ORF Transcript_29140/g.67597 Transcript_29140/m.67597 type:complete len:237 (+) Transcript_29140:60-770(+)